MFGRKKVHEWGWAKEFITQGRQNARDTARLSKQLDAMSDKLDCCVREVDGILDDKYLNVADREEIDARIQAVCETSGGHNWRYRGTGGYWYPTFGSYAFDCECGACRAVNWEDLTAKEKADIKERP